MTLGFVMLVHEPLDRAAEVARFWAAGGCPIVIHVDRRVPVKEFDAFRAKLADFPDIRFSPRRACEWGTWSLVGASQDAARTLLDSFPDVRHVYLASGTCMPLRPVAELRRFLDSHPGVDFIESVTTLDVAWTIGGLDEERFSLGFPFAWKRQRKLFDLWVAIQRKLGIKRRIPDGIEPHLGSQWWCLTRQTLTAILEDPNRRVFERYFRRVWIPDESYFQTMVRRYSRQLESRSLTLSKFDYQGKPHVFYDDHLQLLRRSDCFVVRKVWPGANHLYGTFLGAGTGVENSMRPNPGAINRLFSRSVDRRVRGRAGLYMQSRFPNWDWENGRTASPYHVLVGHGDLFEDFGPWLSDSANCLAHGHLFAPERAEFAGGQQSFVGNLPDAPAIRDHDPRAFLQNLLWNTRGELQSFLFSARDRQDIGWYFALDPNARITVISGAWAVPFLSQNRNFGEIRREAAKLQKIEAAFIDQLRSPHSKARARILTMAEFLDDPVENLHELVDNIGPRDTMGALFEPPKLRKLDGFAMFLQTLRNQGMNPHLAGDFPVEFDWVAPKGTRRPYVVK